MELATMFGVGMLVGIIISKIIFHTFLVGTLCIDNFDPDNNPYMFLELAKDVDAITCKKYVVLNVSIKNFSSHK